MASLFEFTGDSGDSEDDYDYIPENADESSDVSEDEGRFSGEESPIKRQKKVLKSRKKVTDSEFDDSKVDSAHESPNSPVVQKKRADDVWNNFLKEVAETKKANKAKEDADSMAVVDSFLKEVDAIEENMSAFKAAKAAAANTVDKTTTSAEVYEFPGGETDTITKEVNDDGKSNVKSDSGKEDGGKKDGERKESGEKDGINNQASVNVNKKRGGIESVIGSIANKKGKMTTLQKSLLDWKTFKKEEGLEEDLEQYNRGRGGYLEKQKFLQRSDLRRFELEKKARLSKYRKK